MGEDAPSGRTVVESARRALEADVARMSELCGQGVKEVASWRGGQLFGVRDARRRPFAESLRNSLADDSHTVWVGTVNGFVFGYAAAHTEALEDGRTLGVIDDLFVEPAARTIGVGAAMMAGVKGWLETRSCFAIDASAMPGDRLTKNFFEAAGFTARHIVMHHVLTIEEKA